MICKIPPFAVGAVKAEFYDFLVQPSPHSIRVLLNGDDEGDAVHHWPDFTLVAVLRARGEILCNELVLTIVNILGTLKVVSSAHDAQTTVTACRSKSVATVLLEEVEEVHIDKVPEHVHERLRTLYQYTEIEADRASINFFRRLITSKHGNKKKYPIKDVNEELTEFLQRI